MGKLFTCFGKVRGCFALSTCIVLEGFYNLAGVQTLRQMIRQICFSAVACCVLQPAVSHEDDGCREAFAPIKPVQKGSRQQAVFLVMAPPTSEGQSNTSSAGSEGQSSTSSAGSEAAVDNAESEVWYECDAEEWCEEEDEHSSIDDVTQQSSPHTATADASGLTKEQLSCLRALPARLSALLTKYLQVKPQPWP